MILKHSQQIEVTKYKGASMFHNHILHANDVSKQMPWTTNFHLRVPALLTSLAASFEIFKVVFLFHPN